MFPASPDPSGVYALPGDVLELPEPLGDLSAGFFVLLRQDAEAVTLCRASEDRYGDFRRTRTVLALPVDDLARFERTGAIAVS